MRLNRDESSPRPKLEMKPSPKLAGLGGDLGGGPSHLSRVANMMPAMSTRSPTISDVAKLCNVTPATVSRVLNGKTNFSASQRVRDEIMETARKLG
jgi:hypothetical protein